jgi:sorting nexin-13
MTTTRKERRRETEEMSLSASSRAKGEEEEEEKEEQDHYTTSTKLFAFLFLVYFLSVLMASFSNSIAENLPKAFGTVTLLWFGRGRIFGGGEGASNARGKRRRGGLFGGGDSDDEEEEDGEEKSIEEDKKGVIADRRKNNNRRARRFAKLDAKIVESWIKIREVVIKRYVNHWFKTISDDEEVPNACRAVMDDAFLELEKRASRNINLPKLLLSDLPSILQDAFEMYREGKAMIGGGDDDALFSMNKDVVDESLAEALRHMKNGGGEPRLHPAVRNERKQRRLARAYANALASKVLTSETKNGLTEPLARELIVASIHMPIVRLFTPRLVTKLLLILLGTDDEDYISRTNSINEKILSDRRKRMEENLGEQNGTVKEGGIVHNKVTLSSPIQNGQKNGLEGIPSNERSSSTKKKSSKRIGWEVDIAPSLAFSSFRARVTGVEIAGSGIAAFAVYLVSVESLEDGNSWIVPRRYSNFESLHRKLTAINPSFRGYFPPKNWGYNNLDGAFIEKRRQQLDLYVQEMLTDDIVKDCELVFHFLCTRNRSLVGGSGGPAIRNGANADENVSVLSSSEMKPISLSNLAPVRTTISTTNENTYGTPPKGHGGGHRRILSTEQMELLDSPPKRGGKYVPGSADLSHSPLNWETLMRTFDECEQVTAADSVSTIFASEVLNGPMLGLFETVFKMHTKGVVRRSFVALARQTVEFFLGSAVEDFVSRSFNQLQASFLMNLIRDTVWPNEKEGGMTPYDEYKLSLTPEEEKQIDETNKEILRRVLLKRLSQKLSPIVGESTASRGTLELFSIVQSETMCQHVGLLLFETLSCELVPETIIELASSTAKTIATTTTTTTSLSSSSSSEKRNSVISYNNRKKKEENRI